MSYLGRALVENRNGLIAAAMVSHADGYAERDAALSMLQTAEGKAALAANYKVTGGIQIGAIQQPTLLPFPLQQQQALLDASAPKIEYGDADL